MAAAMELRWIDESEMRQCDLSELGALRSRTDGFLWLDIPEWSEAAERTLADDFGFHAIAIEGQGSATTFPGSISMRTISSS